MGISHTCVPHNQSLYGERVRYEMEEIPRIAEEASVH